MPDEDKMQMNAEGHREDSDKMLISAMKMLITMTYQDDVLVLLMLPFLLLLQLLMRMMTRSKQTENYSKEETEMLNGKKFISNVFNFSFLL